MNEPRTRRERLVLGTLLLLGLPLLALALLAAYVYAVNAFRQAGSLHVEVRPAVVFPWQDVHFLLRVDGEPPKSTVTARGLDIAFLIDVSGSMTKSIPTMSEAARNAATQLAAIRGGDVRFALVRFDTKAEIIVPWTTDLRAFVNALPRLQETTGQNNSRELFERMKALVASSRPDARRAMVFYTDGDIDACYPQICPNGTMSYKEIADESTKIREGGIDLFVVGRPGGELNPVVHDITGTTSRIFTPADVNDLAANFDALAATVAGFSGIGAQLSNRIDGRYFSAPIEGTRWVRDPAGTLRLDLGRIPPVPTTYGHPLRPHAAGLWRVGTEPAHLTYASKDGRILEAAAQARPRLLVITWFALFLLLLPWFLWLLTQFAPAAPTVPVVAPALPVRPPPLPAALPALPRPSSANDPVPTLFVGLGGTGLAALHAIRADLEQLHLAIPGPYAFLALDADQREPQPSPFDPWTNHDIVRIVAPKEVVRTRDYLPQDRQLPPHLEWFAAHEYTDKSLEDLNLTEGTKGDRMLARLALFQWLSGAATPLPELEQALDAWLAAHKRVDAQSQIVIVGGAGGGVGCGWFTDVARLFRRLTRQRQHGSELIPEIVGVLVADREQNALNRLALKNELESVSLAGDFPRRVTIQPGHSILDQEERESPFDWLLEAGDDERLPALAQIGALGALLCQSAIQYELLRDVVAESTTPPMVGINGVHVLSTLTRDYVQIDLLLRLLGPDVLDIQPVAGAHESRKMPPAEVRQALERWSAAEASGSPLHRLLAVAADPAAAPNALTVINDTDPNATGNWVVPALRTSVNRALHGHAERGRGRWIRDWQPALAAAVLRLLSERAAAIAAEASVSRPTAAAFTVAAAWATSTANNLEEWVRSLAPLSSEAAARKARLSSRLEMVRTIRRRAYLDPPIDPKEVEDSSRTVLERWLGTVDTLSPLRERLFFSIEADGSVVVQSLIRGRETWTRAEDVVGALEQMTMALASTVSSIRLSSVLMRTTEERRQDLAIEVVDRDHRPDHVVTAAPPAENPPADRDRQMKEFQDAVPQPADYGIRRDLAGDDVSSFRWIGIGVPEDRQLPVPSAKYVQITEREAERMRERIRQRYFVEVPPLPARLRIAVAHPEQFRAFASAYRRGRLITKEDESGMRRWYDLDRREFLTFGAQADLVVAAANYVRSAPRSTPATQAGQGEGDFSALDKWSERRGTMTSDVLVLAAMRVAEEGEGTC